MGELFGALGLAWPRLLLYPGGLTALLAAWLLRRYVLTRGDAETEPQGFVLILRCLPPLAVLTLLPLSPARSFPYGLDLLVALLLLEWPYLLDLARNRALLNERLPALIQSYALLLLAVLALASGAGGFELGALLRTPGDATQVALLCMGMLLWLGAADQLSLHEAGDWARALRSYGHLLLLCLPCLALISPWLGPWLPADAAAWVLPPLSLAIVLLGLTLLRRSAPARLWAGPLLIGMTGLLLLAQELLALL